MKLDKQFTPQKYTMLSAQQRVILAISILLSSSCSHQTMRAGTPLPEVDSVQAQTYVNKCGTCHSVPHPMRHSYSAWQDILLLMDHHMQTRGMLPINQNDKQNILAYLKEHGK